MQDEFDAVLGALEKYKPKKCKYYEPKEKLLTNAKKFYKGRQTIIDAYISNVPYWL